MYQRKRISIMLIVILLLQIFLPMVATTNVVAIDEVNLEQQLVNEVEMNVDTNLETIKFGSYSNENVENVSEEVVKEISTVLENTENISEAYLEWSELSDEEKKNTVEPRKEYIDISELQTNEQFVTSGVTIPERYNLRDVLSEIKTESQGSIGNCYAFAGLNAIETNIALKTGTIYDFSEMHIEYMTSTLLGGSRTFDAGGNFQTVVKYSDDLQGPVLESEIANRSYSESEYTLLKSAKPIVSITETIEFPTINKRYGYTEEELTEFRESVKTHIIENGSVYASIYFSESSNYYNSTTKGYSCLDTSVLTNHAVSIIGWDDSYSKDNFPEANKPSKDGAWIALNSHGSSFGNNGVFYISYEDNWVEYNMSGVVSATNFIDTYGPKVELTNYTNENNSISATINVFDIGGSGVNTSTLKYQWTQSSEQPTLDSFTTTFTNGDTLTKTYADGEQWYLWILAYDTEENYSISGAVQELKFTDGNFYNALCYVLSDSIVSSKVNDDSTYSIFMTQDTVENITTLSLSASFDYPTSHVSEHINNIEGIEQFINLKNLYISSHNITSIDNISFPSGLEHLTLSIGNKLTSINNVVFPSNLKVLDLHQNANLKEINIELPQSIEELDLFGCSAVENWESINFPDNLKNLNLASCNLENLIEDLSFPTTLTTLLIGDNGITNIECLDNLINLEKLCIGANKISDISVIENFTNLKGFTAGDTYYVNAYAMHYGTDKNQIKDISSISFPDTITRLDLGYNKITDASSVNWPDSLDYLYLDNNLIENIEIDMGQHFSYLDLSYNKIKDVSKINISSECTTNDGRGKTRMITLSDNEIQSIPTESWGQSKVNTLILSNNNISNIDNVIWPEGIDSLAIDGNNITALNGVVWKSVLRYLILSDNNISEINNVTWPESLKALELVENNITDLSWIESGTNLLGVALNDNNIYNLESLSLLSKLQELHLDNNYIEDISPLENLSSLSSLHIKKQYITKVIENNENSIEVPKIIKSSITTGSKVYSEEAMTQKNCNISGENIVFDTNELGNIYIMINGGNADGTIVYITDSVDNQLIKSVYKVKTKEDLVKIRDNIVNNGFYDLSNSVIELENDIDLGGYYNETTQEWKGDTWIPLGTKDYPFAGEFEGNGYKITGLYINSDTDYQGLIGYNCGTIQNLTVEGYINAIAGNYIGGICGIIYPNKELNKTASIKNSKSEVDINSTSNQWVGGLTGKMAADAGCTVIIANSYSNGIIEGGEYIGGICGHSMVGTNGTAIIKNCFNTGAVRGGSSVGGICGYNDGDMNGIESNVEIINCYNTGTISGASETGGIVGTSEGKHSIIHNCYNMGVLERNVSYGNILSSGFGYIVGAREEGFRFDGCDFVNSCYYLNQNELKAMSTVENHHYVNYDDEENSVYGLTDEYMKSAQFVDLLNSGNEETVWKKGDSNYPYPMLAWQEYTEEVETVLKGDANGDNVVDFMDILAINKHRLGKAQLTGDSLTAADVNEDGNIDFMDILQINKYRLGKIEGL